MIADVLPVAMILGRVTEARDGAPYKNLKVREIFSKSPALYCVDTVKHVSLCHTTFCTGPFRCGPVVKGVAQAMLKCRALRRSFVFFFLFASWLAAASGEARAQFTDPLSGMQFETMAMANLSLMLSLSQRSVFYQSVPLRLSGDRGRAGSNAQRRTPAAAPESRPVQTPRQYAVTDFRPRRRQSIAEQFASLSNDPQQRATLLSLGDAIFKEIERSPDFRKNNLTYAVALAVGVAVGIERGRDLTDEESEFLLGAVHELLTSDPKLMQQPAAELTALYDTCLLFGGLMTTFHLDAQQNGTRESELAAKRLAKVTLQALGWPTDSAK